MSMSINSAPFVATQGDYANLVKQASTGLRINSAADDAAGAAIAQGFNTQISGQTVAMRNIGDGMSMLQSRMGLSSGLVDQVQRMRELTVQANSAINGPEERALLNKEFTALRDGLSEQVQRAEFNGRKLFSDQATSVQTGANAGQTTTINSNRLDSELASLDFSGLSLGSGNLDNVLERLDGALSALTAGQVQDGAMANRLEQQANGLMRQREDSAASLSRVQDVDYAKLASDLAMEDTRNKVQILMQGQANADRGNVLRLLAG